MNICQCISVHRQVFPEIYLLKFMLHERNLIILTMNRVLKGSYGERCGKTQNIMTGNGIWLLPGRRDSPRFVHRMQGFLPVCREIVRSSGNSESTRREFSGVSLLFFKTLLIFLKYNFKFMINTARPAPNGVFRQKFHDKSHTQMIWKMRQIVLS